MKLIDRMKDRWHEPIAPARLALLRIFVGGYAVWYVYTRQRMMARVARSDAELWEPVGPFRILGHPMDPVAADWMVWLTLLSGVAFILGWAWRYSGPTFAIALLLTLCYRNSWSMIYHMHNGLVAHVLILGFSRAADDVSLDARGRSPVAATSQHGWPVRLICAASAITYFLSGYAKVAGEQGWGWARGDAMREQVAVDALRKQLLEDMDMGVATGLYEHVWIFTLLGVMTYVIELGAPLALVDRRLARGWALGAYGMHWGIYAIMGILFRYQLSFIGFLSFFPIERLLGRREEATVGTPAVQGG